MAKDINQSKVDALVKKGLSQAKVAEKLGVTPGQLGMLRFGQALVNTGQLKKAPATVKSVRDLRDKQSLRWEFIAAATGLSVAKVREMYGDKESYIGRGRKPGNGGSSKASTKSGAKGRASGRGGRAAGRKTSTRGGGRARTRAQRAAKSGNPS